MSAPLQARDCLFRDLYGMRGYFCMQALTSTCVKCRSVAAGGLMQGFDGIVWGVVALQVSL